jgi:DNA uptake protein ComE-like DNA-binding protein
MSKRSWGIGAVTATAALAIACTADTKNNADSLAADTIVTPAATAAGTMPAPSGAAAAGTAASAPATPTSSGTTATTAPASGLGNPNSVTREQLLTIPGIDAALADAIIAGRPYSDNRALNRVLSTRLSADQRKAVYARLWIPIDLNTATGEEILLIPGVGARMRHEFEEYRPYTDIARFRREIGKYVDNAEVARLEQYVTIKR